jgi:hypothetical protein
MLNGLFAKMQHQYGRTIALFYFANYMRQHPEYVNAVTVISEYAAKTALYRCLPHDSAAHCVHALKSMGIDVESVSAGTLGEYALQMAVPAVAEYYSHDHAGIWELAVGTVRQIIEQIQAIAHMGNDNDAGHAKMAKYIKAHKDEGLDAFKAAAIDAYGKGAHWLAFALPKLERQVSASVSFARGGTWCICRTGLTLDVPGRGAARAQRRGHRRRAQDGLHAVSVVGETIPAGAQDIA